MVGFISLPNALNQQTAKTGSHTLTQFCCILLLAKHYLPQHHSSRFYSKIDSAIIENIDIAIKTYSVVIAQPPPVTILPTFLCLPLFVSGIPVVLDTFDFALVIPVALFQENPPLFITYLFPFLVSALNILKLTKFLSHNVDKPVDLSFSESPQQSQLLEFLLVARAFLYPVLLLHLHRVCP